MSGGLWHVLKIFFFLSCFRYLTASNNRNFLLTMRPFLKRAILVISYVSIDMLLKYQIRTFCFNLAQRNDLDCLAESAVDSKNMSIGPESVHAVNVQDFGRSIWTHSRGSCAHWHRQCEPWYFTSPSQSAGGELSQLHKPGCIYCCVTNNPKCSGLKWPPP